MVKKKKLTAFEIERRIGRARKKGRSIHQQRAERKKEILKSRELKIKNIRIREREKLSRVLAKQELQAKRAEERLSEKEFSSIRERLVKKGKEKRIRRNRISSVGKAATGILKKRKTSRKIIAGRAKRFGELAKAFGALPRQASGTGAGRPRGSFKYKIGGKPVSVFEWRKFQAQRRQQLSQFQAQQDQRLSRKGFQPEQLQQLRREQVIQRVQQGKPAMEGNVADQELEFRRHLQRNTVSPRTQQILIALRRTQNKAKSDNIEHERRTHERNLVGRSMNMMRAHTNLNPIKLDFTGVNSEDNILMAPSVFKEDDRANILRTNRLNLMQTMEAGNNLNFF